MKKHELLGLSLALVVFALIAAGCLSEESTGDTAPLTAGALEADVIHLTGGNYGHPQPFSVNPRGPGRSKVAMIFDSLLERDEKGLIPWLAESWTLSPDGREYTFCLREGVRWQDGVSFTADDVKFTIEYKQEHIPAVGGMDDGIIDHVEVIDEHTVKFVLVQPTATFLYKLASLKIIPEHIYSTVTDPITFLAPEAFTGTGPYRLEKFNPEHGSYRFVANDEFWGPRPAIKAVEFIPVSDEVIALEQGEIDFATITPDVLARFERKPDIRIVQQPAFWGYELYFSMNNRPELNDKKVRQAFAYAIDRDELVEKIQRGAGKPGRMGILPEDHIWYNANQPAYDFDAAKARALLDEAGWKDTDGDGIRDKDGKKLSYTLSLASDEVRIGELLKERLRDVGIDIRVKALESKSRDDNLKKGDFELLISGNGDWGIDADYLRTKYTSTTTTPGQGVVSRAASCGYQNDELDALAAREAVELDDEKRKAIVFEMQELFAEEIPAIPLLYTTRHDAWSMTKYDGWMCMYDFHSRTQSKLSFLHREGIAAKR